MNCIPVLVVTLIWCGVQSLPQSNAGQPRPTNVACTEANWVKGHRGCYLFDTTLTSWEDAKDSCASNGAKLVSVGSIAERTFLVNSLKQRITRMSLRSWWVGLMFDRDEQWWQWEDHDYFNDRVTPWQSGEPNGATMGEDCGEIDYTGKFNDQDCSVQHAFICEKHPVTKSVIKPTSQTQTTTIPTKPASTTTIRPSRRSTTMTSKTSTTANINVKFTSSYNQNTSSSSSHSATTTTRPTAVKRVSLTNKHTTSEMDEKTTVSEQLLLNKETTNSPVANNFAPSYCPVKSTSGITWPRTPVNEIANISCGKDNDGRATWQCKTNGEWSHQPQTDSCISPHTKSIITQLGPPTIERTVPIDVALNSMSTLAEVTKEEELSPLDLLVITEFIQNLSSDLDSGNSNVTYRHIASFVKDVARTGSNLLSDNQTETWLELPPSEQHQAAASIMEGVDSSASVSLSLMDEPQTLVVNLHNIELDLRVVDASDIQLGDLTYTSSRNGEQFSLPPDLITANNSTAGYIQYYSRSSYGFIPYLLKIAFITYTDLSHFMSPSTQPHRTNHTPDNTQPPPSIIASNIISVSVHGVQLTNLRDPVLFTMIHTQEVPENSQASCRFWVYASNETLGHWSDAGCRVVRTNQSHTRCACNHLTNFAVLMDIHGTQMGSIHELTLRIITYFGCVISIVCLVTSWLTFQCLRTLQGERNSIHKNLVFCLFLAETVFIIGIDKTMYPTVCAVIAALLHYLFLTAFAWMLMEGVHILFMIVKVFEGSKSQLAYYYFFAYGLPALIISISAAFNYRGYGTDKFCWLSVEKYFMWSFAGPVAAILVVNFAILMFAMITVCRHSEFVMSDKMSTAQNIRGWIQGALGLEVVLGITWLFGYFYISQNTVTMAYIFTVLNSLQGLFIFIFHCLLNKKVRKEYRSVVRMSKSTTSNATRTGSSRSGSLHRKKELPYQMYLPVESG